MRYFKWTIRNGITLWKVREDGMEKCIYDSTESRAYILDYNDWYDPIEQNIRPITEMLGDDMDYDAVELSEDDAILEAI
jgi:hypothetical protein